MSPKPLTTRLYPRCRCRAVELDAANAVMVTRKARHSLTSCKRLPPRRAALEKADTKEKP